MNWLWLDFLIFGNGYGLACPAFNQIFYWIEGRFYRHIGGYGAQLRSFEWRCPLPGTTRILLGRKFKVFLCHKRFIRWDCSWADEEIRTRKDLLNLEDDLRRLS